MVLMLGWQASWE